MLRDNKIHFQEEKKIEERKVKREDFCHSERQNERCHYAFISQLVNDRNRKKNV
jgi:hypothetical protein